MQPSTTVRGLVMPMKAYVVRDVVEGSIWLLFREIRLGATNKC